MDTSAQYTSTPIDQQRRPLRVDPHYLLPSSMPAPQTLGASPFPDESAHTQDNGMARTTSRRRRVSGNGQFESTVQPPAPDVPRAPPLSYRDPYGNGDIPSPRSNNPTSFAARARAIPDNVNFNPDFAHDINIESPVQPTRHTHRAGNPQSSRAKKLQVETPVRESFPASETGPASQKPSNTATQKQYRPVEQSSLQQKIQSPTSGPYSDAESPAQSKTRRGASNAVDSRKEWAADRSPLQKLEVKLSDISKEEKRARVEKAEQSLRESKSGRRRHMADDEAESAASGTATKGLFEDAGSGKRRDFRDDHRQAQGLIPDRATERDAQSPRTARVAIEDRNVMKSKRNIDASQSTSREQRTVVQQPRQRNQPSSRDRTDQSFTRTTDMHNTNLQPERGVRFQSQEPTSISNAEPVGPVDFDPDSNRRRAQRTKGEQAVDSPRSSTVHAVQQERVRKGESETFDNSPRQVPQQQQDLYTHRAQRSEADDSAATYGGAPDPVPGHAVRSSNRALEYEIPPQTASGINARQKVGFGSDSVELAEAPAHHKHHLSNVLHHGHTTGSTPVNSIDKEPRHLDEWRHAGTARLTAADLAIASKDTPDNKAWWEGGRSGTRDEPGKINSGQRRGSQSLDGGFERGYGMLKIPSLDQKKQGQDLIKALRNAPEPIHSRQYLDYDTTSRVKRRNRFWVLGRLSFLNLGRREDPKTSLTSQFAYSCPQLAQHDISHINHICKPYVSKELIKSMRSIRVRVAAPTTSFNPPLYLKCGPLLRYTGLRRDRVEGSQRREDSSIIAPETWRGSVMIVTVDADSSYTPAPTLQLFPEPMDLVSLPPQQVSGDSGENMTSEFIDPIAGLPKLSRSGGTVYVKPVEDLDHGVDLSRVEDDEGLFEETRTAAVPTSYGTPKLSMPPLQGRKNASRRNGASSSNVQELRGVRLHAERGVTFWRFNLEIELGERQVRIGYRINNSASVGFWIPARGETMNMMFHSCNGFSMSVNPSTFSGPDPLWRDVLNNHQMRPFHVMIGGGDQIYNDAVMRQTTLFRDWLGIKNPHHKHDAEFSPQMQEELETFYLERYSMWFSQGLFGMANSQIPMVNIWDDHDIIDGFGSYPHHFMSTPVFSGLGAVAFKYYMLFQHQSVVDEGQADEPSWLLGADRGPYINELSRSVFISLGKHVAFLGLDCRTERMRQEIMSKESYHLVFDRCRREIIEGETKHLIVLLGVPIAYPRLVWLENLLTSRLMDPVKALGRTGMLGGFLNQFDGGVEILDDLDDHWTAKNHKDERHWFVQELQELAAEKSVRVTILGGDVHLAAVGQFYSNPKLKIPKDRDHRYMVNVISSAIVNTPPPEVMGDILNKRNKTHHLDDETDENMIPLFTHDVDGKPRNNKRLLPRRNWCSIREYCPGSTPPPTPPLSEPRTPTNEYDRPPNRIQRTLSLTRNDIKPGNLLRRLSSRGPPPSNDHLPANGYPPSNADATVSPRLRKSEDDYFSLGPERASTMPNFNDRGSVANEAADPPRRWRFPHRSTAEKSELSGQGLKNNTVDSNLNDNNMADSGNKYQGNLNLERGLDIVLNCEISQKDPGGNTAPYRLLIPALWYEGEGDLNTVGIRKPSLLKRLGTLTGVRRARGGLNGRQDKRGSYSGSESFSESDRGEDEDGNVTRGNVGMHRNVDRTVGMTRISASGGRAWDGFEKDNNDKFDRPDEDTDGRINKGPGNKEVRLGSQRAPIAGRKPKEQLDKDDHAKIEQRVDESRSSGKINDRSIEVNRTVVPRHASVAGGPIGSRYEGNQNGKSEGNNSGRFNSQQPNDGQANGSDYIGSKYTHRTLQKRRASVSGGRPSGGFEGNGHGESDQRVEERPTNDKGNNSPRGFFNRIMGPRRTSLTGGRAERRFEDEGVRERFQRDGPRTQGQGGDGPEFEDEGEDERSWDGDEESERMGGEKGGDRPRGYDGVEAYREREKGWRRFF